VRIYLLRHGETDWNVQRRLQGSIDTPLNENGLNQARLWRPYFERLTLAGIYCSSLARAMDTAWLATGRSACIIREFNERGFGVWEGECWVELEKTVSEFDERWNDNVFCPPGGESRHDLFARVDSAMASILSEHAADDEVLIVAHGASGHAIMSTILHHPIEARGSLPPLKNAQLTIMDVATGKGILVGQLLQ
jgi:broad specificity phosphatase PhoE